MAMSVTLFAVAGKDMPGAEGSVGMEDYLCTFVAEAKHQEPTELSREQLSYLESN